MSAGRREVMVVLVGSLVGFNGLLIPKTDLVEGGYEEDVLHFFFISEGEELLASVKDFRRAGRQGFASVSASSATTSPLPLSPPA